MTDSSDGRAGIDVRLVEQLIATQFPQWSRLPVTPVAHDGHDNRTYRLGEELTVRLPTAAPYASGITKESRWLPALGPALPLRIPVPTVHRARAIRSRGRCAAKFPGTLGKRFSPSLTTPSISEHGH
ncbi:phosphotransferase [Nocardia rhamnosiphila]|uniref:phosphotransferase n=1 Tax=Nocardia rhamnosiphila TaxID=426716 RepID=UPI0033E9FD6A